MKLDPRLWDALQEHGVEVAHLEMLLRLLQCQRNGHVSWYFVHGNLTQCDMRLVMPSRSYEIARVSEALLDGNSLVR